MRRSTATSSTRTRIPSKQRRQGWHGQLDPHRPIDDYRYLWWKTPASTYYYVPGTTAYAPSFVLMGGRLTIGANGNTVTGGPVGKGPLFIAPLTGTGGGPVTLTANNSPTGYTISNPVIFGNSATGVSTGSATLGDASNDALTLSGNVTLASFNYGTGGGFWPAGLDAEHARQRRDHQRQHRRGPQRRRQQHHQDRRRRLGLSPAPIATPARPYPRWAPWRP